MNDPSRTAWPKRTLEGSPSRRRMAAALLGLAGVSLLAPGCSQYLNVPPSKLIADNREVSWKFAATPDQLLEAVLAERDVEAKRTDLTLDRDDRLLSWVTPVDKWGDLLADASSFPINEKGRALTTVWIEPVSVDARSAIYINRSFIGDNCPSNIGPSRGDYEADFVARLRKRLHEQPAVQPNAKENHR